MPCDRRVLPDCPLNPRVESGAKGLFRLWQIIGISAAAQPGTRQIWPCDRPEPDMPATTPERCEDAAGSVACDNHPKIILAAPGQMHGLVKEDVRVEPVMHRERWSHGAALPPITPKHV